MPITGGNKLAPGQVSHFSGSLAGTTAGTVTYEQITIGGIKVMVLYFNGYENDTTTNQTITFPIAYTNAPTVAVGNSTLPAFTTSTTVLTITAPDAVTLFTGSALVIGS